MKFSLHIFVLCALSQGICLSKPLKILVAVTNFPKLSETFVVNQIIGMINYGHEVAIYANFKENTDKVHEDVLAYNLLDKVYYKKLPEDIETYDILLGEFGTAGSRMIKFKNELGLKAKVVTFFRGADITSYLANNPNRYDNLFAQGDFFLTNCEYFRQKILAQGISPKKVIINYSSINLDRFKYTERTPDFDKEIRLITSGRIVAKKGIHVALDALALLIKEYPQIKYYIAGDGSFKNTINQKVKDLGLEDYVIFTGPYTADELPELLNKADIFVGPSVTAKSTDQDAIPNTLKEAMAMGLPVVATYHGGISEMITDGENGLLTEEYDHKGLANKIAYYIEHKEELPRITKAGRKTIEDLFELNYNNKKLIKILKKVAAGEL